MRHPAIESASDPLHPPCTQAIATIEWGVPSTTIPALSFKSSTSLAHATGDTGLTANPPRDIEMQPALSFGFSTPQPRGVTSPDSGFDTPSSRKKPLLGASSIWMRKPVSSPLSVSAATSKASAHHVALKGDGALPKAINRASMGRPAIIRRQEIAADGLVTSYLTSANESPSNKTLATELADIARTHPTIFSFLQHVFDKISYSHGAPSPQSYRSMHVHRQSHTERSLVDSFHCDFDDDGWGEDVGDYILRMMILGVPPREIRAAVKKEMDWTHGRNHVAANDVQGIMEWVRGPAALMVENSRVHGSAMNFFRPCKQEEERYAKMTIAGKHLQSWQTGGSAKIMAYCRCSEEHEALTLSEAATTAANAAKKMTPDQSLLKKPENFRFMDLPAEMRVWVGKAALVSTGYISLRSCAHHMPAGVHPQLAVSLFRTSKP